MGGSGSGGPFAGGRTPDRLAKLVRDAEQKNSSAEFNAALAQTLNGLLSELARDVDLVRDRLTTIEDSLSGVLEQSLDQLFGGSVAKHTYVDGLSDVDTLLLINETGLENKKPNEVLQHLASILQKDLGNEVRVSHGDMAVTVTFPSGPECPNDMDIQLLPAIKMGNGHRIPSSRRPNEWSHVIDPESFQKALTRRNEQCGMKLIPVIKLAKAIIGNLPESQRLSGYHIESLAISAFKHYDGDKTTSAMVPFFFEKAKNLVLSPIKDKTGQSIHVDDYLGAENSEQRIAASHIIGRIGRRMLNATAAESIAQWNDLFGLALSND